MQYSAAAPDGITSVAEIDASFTLTTKIMAACHVAPCRVSFVTYALRKKKKLSIDHGCYDYRVVTR